MKQLEAIDLGDLQAGIDALQRLTKVTRGIDTLSELLRDVFPLVNAKRELEGQLVALRQEIETGRSELTALTANSAAHLRREQELTELEADFERRRTEFYNGTHEEAEKLRLAAQEAGQRAADEMVGKARERVAALDAERNELKTETDKLNARRNEIRQQMFRIAYPDSTT